MFANYIKLIFVITAYSPIFLVVWIVSLYNSLNEGISIGFVDHYTEIFNKLNFIWIFIILLLISFLLIKKAEKQLTINRIEIDSIKSADLNMSTLLISYILPCIELFKKDSIYIFIWIVLFVIIVIISKNTFFYNPLLKIFGYKYYEVVTKKKITYVMISKKKLINTNQISSYSQLTDYVILNRT